jgi:hypothetical protein
VISRTDSALLSTGHWALTTVKKRGAEAPQVKRTEAMFP